MLEIYNYGKIREIRLARPPVNALNPELVRLLTKALCEAQTECNALVLSGREGVFSAGLDLIELIHLDRAGMTSFWRSFFKLLETIACSQVPVAVAITGHSPAGGAVMSMMADYRVMCRGNYIVGLNETRVGLVIPAVLQNTMARLVGSRIAESMVVAGTLVNPEDALKIGFVDALETDYEATVQHAVGWCEDLLSLPTHSMLGNRGISRAHFKTEFASNTADGVSGFVESWFSEETQVILNDMVDKLKNKSAS